MGGFSLVTKNSPFCIHFLFKIVGKYFFSLLFFEKNITNFKSMLSVTIFMPFFVTDLHYGKKYCLTMETMALAIKLQKSIIFLLFFHHFPEKTLLT
jgi:hypothetical protein